MSLNADDETDNIDEGIDLPALGRLTWRYRRLFLITIAICGLGAVALAVIAKPIYRGETVIAEVHEQSVGGSGSIVNQLGSIASLVGMSLPTTDSTGRQAQAVLQSRHLIEVFVARYQLLADICRNEGKRCTLWTAVSHFRTSVLQVREDTRRGVTTVSVDWTDPTIAARWANDFVALANELIRQRAINDSTRNIAYLNEQVTQTRVVEIQRVMYDLIENETKTLMLANGRSEYAFTVVDPAVPPENRVSPKRVIMVILGLAAGVVLGFVMAVTRDKLRRQNRAVSGVA